jgi:hypothetical protein
MQGFFVKTTGSNARLELVYNRVVYDAKYYKTTTSPMRSPRRSVSASEEPSVMQISVYSSHGADRVSLLSRAGFTEEFEDGWDGRKLYGDTAYVPMLAVNKDAGNMAIAAVNSFEERELSFRAGADTEYTFSFDYAGETIYLYDRLADIATEIKTGNTYSFLASNKTPIKRFLITKNPPRVPTGIEDISSSSHPAEKCIIDGVLYIIRDNHFYDARGIRVGSLRKEGAL